MDQITISDGASGGGGQLDEVTTTARGGKRAAIR